MCEKLQTGRANTMCAPWSPPGWNSTSGVAWEKPELALGGGAGPGDHAAVLVEHAAPWRWQAAVSGTKCRGVHASP